MPIKHVESIHICRTYFNIVHTEYEYLDEVADEDCDIEECLEEVESESNNDEENSTEEYGSEDDERVDNMDVSW